MTTTALQYVGRDGQRKNMEVDVSIYKTAEDNKMSLRKYVERKLESAPEADQPDYSYGDPLDQMYAMAGLGNDKGDRKFMSGGVTLHDAMSGKMSADATAGLRAPGSSDESGTAARLLYPQLILETVEAQLRDEGPDILSVYNDLVAVSRSLSGPRVEQPLINTQKTGEGPDGSRSRRQAQMAEPATMVSITTGERSYRVPTYAIGLQISDEAMQATTIDLVNVIMQKQARAERIAMFEEQLHDCIFGNIDRNMEALPVTSIGTFDKSITQDGQITKRAYLKWLRSNYRIREITDILTDLDTIIDLDESLMPKSTGPDNSKIPTLFPGFDMSLTMPRFVDLEQSIFGAGMLVGIDRSNAIQRFVNVSADYSGVENYVLRKAQAFRVDYGEMSTRLFDDAWSVVSLTK